MSKQDTSIENDITRDCTTEQEQTKLQLERLTQQLNMNLPQLPAQHEVLLGTALLNLALARLIDAQGQPITADLLAGIAELLWNNDWPESNIRHN